MTFSVNGVPLTNGALGWSLLDGSKLRLEGSAAVSSLDQAGRDGVVPGLASTDGAAVAACVVDVPSSSFGALVALFRPGGSLTTSVEPDKAIRFEYASHTVEGDPDDSFVQVTFVLRFPRVFWRDKLDSTVSAPLLSASVELDAFSGISAPVQDAVVRVQGAASGVQVTDSSGAWVTLPPATAGQWVRFESDTGKCFRTTTDVWSGGTDVSGLVDFGGPRGIFEIAPLLAPADPSTRVGRLTVSSATRTGAVVAVRGKAAYAL